MSNSKNIAEQLRRAIAQAERRGMTRYAIAKATELPQSAIGRIAKGENVPTLTTAERIAKVIGYKLTLAPIVEKKVASKVR